MQAGARRGATEPRWFRVAGRGPRTLRESPSTTCPHAASRCGAMRAAGGPDPRAPEGPAPGRPPRDSESDPRRAAARPARQAAGGGGGERKRRPAPACRTRRRRPLSRDVSSARSSPRPQPSRAAIRKPAFRLPADMKGGPHQGSGLRARGAASARPGFARSTPGSSMPGPSRRSCRLSDPRPLRHDHGGPGGRRSLGRGRPTLLWRGKGTSP